MEDDDESDTDTLKTVPVTQLESICTSLIQDYVYALRSTMANEACSKRPREWLMNALMTDGIRNIYAAQMIVQSKGRIGQPGPFDQLNNLAQDSSDNNDNATPPTWAKQLIDDNAKVMKKLNL